MFEYGFVRHGEKKRVNVYILTQKTNINISFTHEYLALHILGKPKLKIHLSGFGEEIS